LTRLSEPVTLDNMNADEESNRRSSREAARFRRESLKFLIGLSEVDLVALLSSDHPGDLLNLVWGFYRFAYLGTNSLTLDEASEQARDLADAIRAKPERLGRAIDGVRSLLKSVTEGNEVKLEFLPGTAMVIRISPEGTRDSFLYSPIRRSYEGLRQTLMFKTMRLLDTEEGQLVRQCARKDCRGPHGERRLFLASRPKQVFCGRRCANAATFERYRRRVDDEAYRAQHREAARKSWRRKQGLLGRKIEPRIKGAAKEKEFQK
jgi:hypothetical protein